MPLIIPVILLPVKKRVCVFIHLLFELHLWIPPTNLLDSLQSAGKAISGSFYSSKNWCPWSCRKLREESPGGARTTLQCSLPERGCGFLASTWVCGLSRSCSPKLVLKEVWTYLCPVAPHLLHSKQKKMSSSLYRSWIPLWWTTISVSQARQIGYCQLHGLALLSWFEVCHFFLGKGLRVPLPAPVCCLLPTKGDTEFGEERQPGNENRSVSSNGAKKERHCRF